MRRLVTEKRVRGRLYGNNNDEKSFAGFVLTVATERVLPTENDGKIHWLSKKNK